MFDSCIGVSCLRHICIYVGMHANCKEMFEAVYLGDKIYPRSAYIGNRYVRIEGAGDE
jgi:hypothetical protein